ncbi:kish-B [Brachionus plicatilis]|uniref:Protein kish n=1 Tax=Brachionus plicatilis TaxID=10195 RepID=A0A3M7SAG8_BRAPC|nr:kish-B [Brachionus plicatilis]
MVNAYSFDGLLVLFILVICSCSYFRRIPKIRQLFLSEKKGFAGIFYKASVIGTRLHHLVSIACVTMAAWIVFFR